jgi:galactokinase
MSSSAPSEPEAAPTPTRGSGAELDAQLRAHGRRFREIFGGEQPPRLFFAPGRVNLMGAHLDYNGGPVMPLAIDRGTFVAIRPRTDGRLCLRSTREEGQLVFDLAKPPERAGRWHDYPTGVFRALTLQGRAGTGIDILFGGNLPIGAGLSSSASICVATAFALDRVWGLGLGGRGRVDAALAAEREFVGVQCGVMDPFAIGLARPDHILWLDCKDLSNEHLALDTRHVLVAVADTGVRRELAQGSFNERVAQARAAFAALTELAGPQYSFECLRDVPLELLDAHGSRLAPVLERRARHVLEEVRRTFEARECLRAGNLAGFGALMLAAHASLRELYEVSVPELDCLVDSAALEPAVFGARLTGAGFGGCVAILLRRGEEEAALARVAETFKGRFGRLPKIEVFGGDPGPREVAQD